MAKFIYYTDLHYGPDIPRQNKHGINLLGSTAPYIQDALINYAEKSNIKTIIHGGDETTYHPIPEKWFERAQKASALMQQFNGTMIRVIGNHDYDARATDLGFEKHSFLTQIDESLPAYILQPTCMHTEQTSLYKYHKNDANNLRQHTGTIEDSSNLIIAGHWALNRQERGYPEMYHKIGYAYKDNCNDIKNALKALPLKSAMTLHGHEHRFALSTLPDRRQITHLLMPSIVQHDINDLTKPCGIFVEINDETKSGQLTWEFKKILPPRDMAHDTLRQRKITVTDLSHHQMKAYSRPVRPENMKQSKMPAP